jgi:hypothetical protein
MKPGSDIWNELNELSPVLAGLPRVNVFTVPQGYFDSLGTVIMASLGEEDPVLFKHGKLPVSSDVPAGYFDGLADSILAKIKAGAEASALEEMRSLSPMLYSIQGENVYQVPAGYFDGLAAELNAKVQPAAKVVPIHRRAATFMKYAVAAVFTGVMALGVFKFTNNKSDKLDDVVLQGLEIAKTNTLEQEMNQLSDADIVKYLSSNGENVDLATVTKYIDEKNLPSQEDYLTDDKALDNYLDKLSAEDLNN